MPWDRLHSAGRAGSAVVDVQACCHVVSGPGIPTWSNSLAVQPLRRLLSEPQNTWNSELGTSLQFAPTPKTAL